MQRRDFLTTMAASGALSFGRATSLAVTDEGTNPKKAEPKTLKTDAEIFSQEELKPRGKYYEATVPDTLDLAERGRLGVRGLINVLNPDLSYQPYEMAFFNTNPPYMSNFGWIAVNWGKITEGILMTRHMSGSTDKLSEEEAMFQKGVLALVRENGEFADDISTSMWKDQLDVYGAYARTVDTSRMFISFMVQNQLRPSPRLTQLIVRMADNICQKAKFKDDYAYLWESEPNNSDIQFMHGTSLRGLCRTYAMTGDPKYLEMAGKFKNLLLKPKYWAPEAAPKAVTGGEHGQFDGHMHSYTSGLMGLLWYADLTNDAQLKEFVRESYEYLRTYGIARIGMFGEMCMTGDMTYLAIKLSDLGVGDYWEDVDQYVRNQLVEQQVTDAEKLRRAVETMPKLTEMMYPEYAKIAATTDQVIERNVGAYLSDASNPTLVRPQTFRWTICCSGNCPPGLYGAWEGTVRYHAGVAQVNLLLNRASPWLDMDSYLPYEGRVVIRNKAAEKMFVRMPRWVENDKVRVEVNGKRGESVWVGRYLFLDGVRVGDNIRIDFPVVESKETCALKWKTEEMWWETTNPGKDWKPHDSPDQFTLHLKGNTVVDVTPRTEGPGYSLYDRVEYQKAVAPMKQVRRYVSPVVVKW